MNSKLFWNKVSVFFFLYFFILSNVWAGKIVIIGAGLSGLTTAVYLQSAFQTQKQFQDQNWSIVVFDAQNYYGGRILTHHLNGQPVEMGGENIRDGGEAKNFRDLAKTLGLKTHSYLAPARDNYFFDPETKKTYPIYEHLMPAFPVLSHKALEKTLSQIEEKSENMKEVIDIFFEGLFTQNEDQNQKLQILKRVFTANIQNLEGGEAKNLSTHYAVNSFLEMINYLQDSYELFHTGKPRFITLEGIEGGNSRLISALVDKLGKEKIYLNSPLEKVQISSEGQLDLSFGGTEAKRTTADLLVLTIPGKVYKKIEFGEGTVPSQTLDLMGSIPYGTHAKIIIPVSKPSDNTVSASTMTSWLNPENKQITLYFNGQEGIMTDQKAFSKNLAFGARAYQNLGLSLEKNRITIPSTKIFSEYDGPVGKSWATVPYIEGSYAYSSPATKKILDEEVEIIDGTLVLTAFKPIERKGSTIYFAGEHTTPFSETRGTMEAAVTSGKDTSELIIKQRDRVFSADPTDFLFTEE